MGGAPARTHPRERAGARSRRRSRGTVPGPPGPSFALPFPAELAPLRPAPQRVLRHRPPRRAFPATVRDTPSALSLHPPGDPLFPAMVGRIYISDQPWPGKGAPNMLPSRTVAIKGISNAFDAFPAGNRGRFLKSHYVVTLKDLTQFRMVWLMISHGLNHARSNSLRLRRAPP